MLSLRGQAKKLAAAGHVPLDLAEQWLLGEMGDPLSAPFALLLERFSTRGLEDDPELFEDEHQKFRLLHTRPVEVPLEMAVTLHSAFLRRDQLAIVRDVFNFCSTQLDFAVSHEEAEAAIGRAIDTEFWCGKLRKGLEEVEQIRLNLAWQALVLLFLVPVPLLDRSFEFGESLQSLSFLFQETEPTAHILAS